MCDITLCKARYLAKYAAQSWSEVGRSEKRKVVVFRPRDTDCGVRRVIIHYGLGVIQAVLQDGNDTEKSVVVRRTNATAVVLGRFLENPELYKKLGFRAAGSCCWCCKNKTDAKDISDCEAKDKKKCTAKCAKCKAKLCWKPENKCEHECVRMCKRTGKDMHSELIELKKTVKELKDVQKKLKKKADKEEDDKKVDTDDEDWTPKLRSYVSKDVRSELCKLRLDKVECVHLMPDGAGFVHSEKNGEVYWSSEIDAKIGECLERSTEKDRPQAMCIGTEGRHFVRFTSGDFECSGPPEVMHMVRTGNVRMVAFGGDADSYVVIFENGNAVWNDVPESLHRLLCECVSESVGVDFVAMGGSGQYFARYGDKVQYGNLCDTASKALDECPGRLTEVTFGGGDALLARYQVKK